MSVEAFENVRDQVSACGIWCGSCAVGNGVISDLAARYEQLLRAYGLAEWGPKEIDYDVLFGNLKAMHEMPGCPGCRQGGGLEGCAMRICAAEKELEECIACDEYGTCQHTKALQQTLKGATAAKMVVKTASGDSAELITRWMDDLQGTWPNGVMFMKENDPEVSD